MKQASIREIKHQTTRVMDMVASGHSVEIRKRSKPVAILSPVPSTKTQEMPDFEARLREIYGDRILETTHTDLINQARGDR